MTDHSPPTASTASTASTREFLVEQRRFDATRGGRALLRRVSAFSRGDVSDPSIVVASADADATVEWLQRLPPQVVNRTRVALVDLSPVSSPTAVTAMTAGLQVLAVMIREGRPLSELASVMTRYPQVLVNVVVQQKRPLEQLPELLRVIADVERQLGDDGRVLVRYSGTEPKARVMVEGPDESVIRPMAEGIAEQLRRACSP